MTRKSLNYSQDFCEAFAIYYRNGVTNRESCEHDITYWFEKFRMEDLG